MIINYIMFNPVIILMPVISMHEPEGTYISQSSLFAPAWVLVA